MQVSPAPASPLCSHGRVPYDPPVRILFIADIFGAPGRRAVEAHLPRLRDRARARPGGGQRRERRRRRRASPAASPDACTRPAWTRSRSETTPTGSARSTRSWASDDRIVRPANYADQRARARRDGGRRAADGTSVAVINLIGQLYLDAGREPVRGGGRRWSPTPARRAPVVLVDFHAEATSEKVAMGRLLDGSVTAVIGTHTHIQTNDAARAAGRHRLPHRRRHDRPPRLGDRRPHRAGAAPVPDRAAGAVRAGRAATSASRAR